MAEKIRWGLLSTARIARAFAKGVKASSTGELAVVASRSLDKAQAFADENDVPRALGSYEKLLADPEVDAVYVATPHTEHARWCIAAAEAGKHVLCEKPIATNAWETQALQEAALGNGVVTMEAFMYRAHPQTAKLAEVLKSGAIGDVVSAQIAFAFRGPDDPLHRLQNPDLAGGGIMDVGCYPVSLARLVAGAAAGTDFANPTSVKGVGHIGPSGVDDWAVAVLGFDTPFVAQVATGVRVRMENSARIYGTEGMIYIKEPWKPNPPQETWSFTITKGQDVETISGTADHLYSYEADALADAVANNGIVAAPAMSSADTLGNMKTLDAWRKELGLVYPRETFEGGPGPIEGKPLAFPASGTKRIRGGATIPRVEMEGLNKPVARLVMGVDNQRSFEHAAVQFDDYVNRGGNIFDTSNIYGGGRCEKVLGEWIRSRGVQDEVVVLSKGAHTPECLPDKLAEHVPASLENMGLDYVDLYCMHRDNLDVPVSEFVDILDGFVQQGLIKRYGGSNWSIERLEEANAYAVKNGKTGFSLVSNNFSLARMVDPVWRGCIAASTPEFRAWLTEHQVPLLPWSSQARGFFTDRAGPDKLNDGQLVRCWYADDNWERRRRAVQLAEERGVSALNIALAYVLCQPFPTFPLIGPRSIEELRTSLPGLEVSLSTADLAWLNLESDSR